MGARESDDAMATLYRESLRLDIEKFHRNSGVWERFEAVSEEMRMRYGFLLEKREGLCEEELDMVALLEEYDRL